MMITPPFGIVRALNYVTVYAYASRLNSSAEFKLNMYIYLRYIHHYFLHYSLELLLAVRPGLQSTTPRHHTLSTHTRDVTATTSTERGHWHWQAGAHAHRGADGARVVTVR